MKKRIFALTAAVALLLTLSACGGGGETPEPSPEPSQEASATPVPTPEPQVDLSSYIGSYKNQDEDTVGLDVSMEGDNLRVMAYQPRIVFFDEVVSPQSLQGNQLHFVAEDPVTQENFNVDLTFDGARITMTSTSPQLGESGVYIPGEASELPIIEEPVEDPPQNDVPQSTIPVSLSDYSGEYTYIGPADDPYILTLDDAVDGVKMSIFWRGMYTYEDVYIANEDGQDTGDGSYTYPFVADGETRSLVLWPSSDGGQKFYLDDVGPFAGDW